MWSQSTVAKSRKFQFEHKFVLRLAQSDLLLHSSCTYTLRGSPPLVCGLCVQYETALNPERREIIVFSLLSTHMDKCTWCLGGGVSVAATPNIMGVWYLAQRHLSSAPSPLLLPDQCPFYGDLLGLQIDILHVQTHSEFENILQLQWKAQNLQPQKTQSLNKMCIKLDTSRLKAAGTGSPVMDEAVEDEWMDA